MARFLFVGKKTRGSWDRYVTHIQLTSCKAEMISDRQTDMSHAFS